MKKLAASVLAILLFAAVLRAAEVRVFATGDNWVLTNYYRVAGQTGLLDGAPLVNCGVIGMATGYGEVVIAASTPDKYGRRTLCICDGVEWQSLPEGGDCGESPVIP